MALGVHPDRDGYYLAGHSVLQKAIDAEIITWDKAVWAPDARDRTRE
ncbi:hypothetical protein R4282_31900 [Rhodococcus oxybenzonivorans]|nr:MULTISPECIES: hypothetical protein [Rhodococcus]MDV7357601.1 hypothetical protein [Rhodococcus oxybenzonivorans]QHE67791.1 hypothetical protein GFS60_01298 [Rhodococcus sp. WAY2]